MNWWMKRYKPKIIGPELPPSDTMCYRYSAARRDFRRMSRHDNGKVIRTYMEAYDRVVNSPHVRDQYPCESCGGWHLTSQRPIPRNNPPGTGTERNREREERRRRSKARKRIVDAMRAENPDYDKPIFLTRAQVHERWGWT